MLIEQVAERAHALLAGGGDRPFALGIDEICPRRDLVERGLAGFWRIEPGVDERHLHLRCGIGVAGTLDGGVHRAMDVGLRFAAHHADDVRLRESPGQSWEWHPRRGTPVNGRL